MVEGGINKEVFLSFLRCHKLALYENKFGHLRDSEKNSRTKSSNAEMFKKIAHKVIFESEDGFAEKIIKNKCFSTKDGEKVWADLIVKRLPTLNPPTKSETILFEIVCSSNSKDGEELTWLAYKLFLIKKCNYNIDRVFLVKIDNKYQNEGNISDQYLYVTDVTNKLRQFMPNIPSLLLKIKKYLIQGRLPEKQKDPNCLEPFPCPFLRHCWQDMPIEGTVFEIKDMAARAKFNIYWDQMHSFEDIPRKRLDKRQFIQVKNGMQNKTRLKKEKLANWLNKINEKEKVLYFDIGFASPAVPLLTDTKPFATLPFCLSIIYKFPNNDNFTSVYDMRYDNYERPLDICFVSDLVSKLSRYKSSTIIVYDKSRIKKAFGVLSEKYPSFSEELNLIEKRLLDLKDVFYDCMYYVPSLKGAYELNEVAPVLLKSFYLGQIKSNNQAANLFLKSFYKLDKLSAANISDIKTYYSNRTIAMKELVKFLKDLTV